MATEQDMLVVKIGAEQPVLKPCVTYVCTPDRTVIDVTPALGRDRDGAVEVALFEASREPWRMANEPGVLASRFMLERSGSVEEVPVDPPAYVFEIADLLSTSDVAWGTTVVDESRISDVGGVAAFLFSQQHSSVI